MQFNKYRIGLIVALFFGIALLFNNCGAPGYNTISSSQIKGFSNGNGNGYVGIDSPAVVAEQTTYSAFAMGGTGPYVFEIVSGPGQIIATEKNRVDIQTADIAIEASIQLKVTDADGNTGFASTLVFRRDEPYGLSDFKHSFYGPRVIVKDDLLLIGRADTTYFDFARMNALYQSGLNIESPQYHGGYVSLIKKNSENNWGLLKFLTAREACAELALNLNIEKIYPYDFGEHYSFDGEQLAIRFGFIRGAPAASQDWSVLKLENVTLIYTYNRENDSLILSHTLFDRDNLSDTTRNLNKPVHISGEYLFNAVVQADRLNEHVRIFRKQNNNFERVGTIEIPVADANIKSINFYEDGLYVFSEANISGLSYVKNQNAKLWIYQLVNGAWQLEQKFYPDTQGSFLSVARKNDALITTSLIGESDQSDVDLYSQELAFYKKINNAWVLQSKMPYNDYSVCKNSTISSENVLVLGCAAPLLGHPQPTSVNAATLSEIPIYHLTGTLIVLHRDASVGWRVHEKIYDPSEYDPNYSGFGWSLSTDQGYVGVSNYFSDAVHLYKVPNF